MSLQVGDPYEVLSPAYLADSVSVQAGRDVEFGLSPPWDWRQRPTINITCGGTAKFNGCGSLDLMWTLGSGGDALRLSPSRAEYARPGQGERLRLRLRLRWGQGSLRRQLVDRPRESGDHVIHRTGR